MRNIATVCATAVVIGACTQLVPTAKPSLLPVSPVQRVPSPQPVATPVPTPAPTATPVQVALLSGTKMIGFADKPAYLPAGNRTFTVVSKGTYFSVQVYDKNNKAVASPIVRNDGAPYSGSASYPVEGGVYTFYIATDGDWTLTID